MCFWVSNSWIKELRITVLTLKFQRKHKNWNGVDKAKNEEKYALNWRSFTELMFMGQEV